MRRRAFLASGVSLGIGGVASAGTQDDSGEGDDSDGEVDGETDGAPRAADLIAYDPYADVDWASVTRHKAQFHAHPRNTLPTPADVVDFYQGTREGEQGRTVADAETYSVYPVADKGDRPMKFPWTEFSAIDESYEDRDPEDLGVVAFPAAEGTIGEHVLRLFTAIEDRHLQAETRYGVIQETVERTAFHEPRGLAVLAHPAHYRDGPGDWDAYADELAEFSREDGFVGMEAFSLHDPLGEENRPLWDAVLSATAAERLFWGFGADDAVEYAVGESADLRWTTLLLHDDEFDPSDQAASRDAASSAVVEGRTLAKARGPVDDEEQYPTPAPTVTGITVGERGIALTAERYTSIRWISDGEVVDTGPWIELTTEHSPYVRAELELERDGVRSMACTQPWGIAPPGEASEQTGSGGGEDASGGADGQGDDGDGGDDG